MEQNSGFQMSQGYDVLPPKSSRAYPIPCDEWDLLKIKIQSIASPPAFFSNVGAVLIGAAITTFITILTGAYSDQAKQYELVVASAVVVVCLISGILSYIFSRLQQNTRRVLAGEIISQMELIEHRYKQ